MYFTHSMNSMVMGYLDLLLKICEIFIYLIVQIFKAVMFVFPWRKKLLDEKLKEGKSNTDVTLICIAKNIYVGAALICLEGVQTLIDLPFIVLTLPIFIIQPHKINYIINDFKTKTADSWRMMILKYYPNAIMDIPYIIMLLIIGVSVFQAIALKK